MAPTACPAGTRCEVRTPATGTAPMIRVTILYPTGSGSRFDHDYYQRVHLPLAQRLLGPYGLRRVETDRVLEGADPTQPASYHCIGFLYFDTVADFRRGMAAHGAEIAADVPNYATLRATVLIGETATD